MRISDWSSYVCSSDLDHRQTATEPQIAHQVGEVCDLGMHHQRSRHLHAREVHTVAHVVHTIGHALVRLDLLYLAEIFADMLCRGGVRSEEHTSELQSLMRISYAVFCLTNTKHYLTKKKKSQQNTIKEQ